MDPIERPIDAHHDNQQRVEDRSGDAKRQAEERLAKSTSQPLCCDFSTVSLDGSDASDLLFEPVSLAPMLVDLLVNSGGVVGHSIEFFP